MAEKVEKVVGNSHFSFTTTITFSIVAATNFVALAIEGYNWHLKNFVLTMHLVVFGSIFSEVFSIVEGFSIGFGYLARAENSNQRNFDYQLENMY